MRRLLKLALLFLLLAPCASTTNTIQGWYAWYNGVYFSGLLPADVRVEVFYAGKGPDGVDNKGVTFACDSPARLCIFVDPTYNPDWGDRKATLLHEMIHVKLGINPNDGPDGHGPKFKKELHRLMDEGAFDDIL